MKWKHSGRELWLLEWPECKIHFLICLDSHFRPDWRRHKCFLDIVMVTLVILEISSVNTLISSFFPKRIFKVSHVAYWRRISEEFIHVIRDPRMVFYQEQSVCQWFHLIRLYWFWARLIGSVTDVRFQSDHLSANLVECSRTPSLRTEKISRIGKWQKSHAAKIGRNRLISFIIPNKTEFLAHCLTATAEIYTILTNLLIAVFVFSVKMSHDTE